MRITYEGNKWPRLQGESIKLFQGANFDLGKKKNFSIFGVEVIENPLLPATLFPSMMATIDKAFLETLTQGTSLLRFARPKSMPKSWPTLCGQSIDTRKISFPKMIDTRPFCAPGCKQLHTGDIQFNA